MEMYSYNTLNNTLKHFQTCSNYVAGLLCLSYYHERGFLVYIYYSQLYVFVLQRECFKRPENGVGALETGDTDSCKLDICSVT